MFEGMEVIKDLAVVWGPFVACGAVGVMLENRKERKEMRARHNKRFEEIKRNNRRRQGLE